MIKENQIVKYLVGSDFDKYSILKLLNEKKVFDASIPIMIELSERLDENILTFNEFLTNLELDFLSSNSAYLLSKYFMKNLEFRKSINYAEISIQRCKNNFELSVLKSHLKKVKTFN